MRAPYDSKSTAPCPPASCHPPPWWPAGRDYLATGPLVVRPEYAPGYSLAQPALGVVGQAGRRGLDVWDGEHWFRPVGPTRQTALSVDARGTVTMLSAVVRGEANFTHTQPATLVVRGSPALPALAVQPLNGFTALQVGTDGMTGVAALNATASGISARGMGAGGGLCAPVPPARCCTVLALAARAPKLTHPHPACLPAATNSLVVNGPTQRERRPRQLSCGHRGARPVPPAPPRKSLFPACAAARRTCRPALCPAAQ